MSAQPKTMRALVQDGTGSADVLHLREIEVPPIADDRVLVRVLAASVNAADYHTVHGGAIITVIGKMLRQTLARISSSVVMSSILLETSSLSYVSCSLPRAGRAISTCVPTTLMP